MILIDELDNDVAVPFAIPAASVGKQVGNEILSYVNSTRFAKASSTIKFGCVFNINIVTLLLHA